LGVHLRFVGVTACKRIKGEEKRKGKLSGTSSSRMRSAILFSFTYDRSAPVLINNQKTVHTACASDRSSMAL